ncbi:MAG: amidohydrolase family protein [Clostridia bacterium]|nr:amidohydrolase family protein [Clostridia bacterium]
MIIDFHVHIFPDKIATVAVDTLSNRAKIPAYTDGTLTSTLENMEKAGIDISVVQSIATNPKQTKNVNDFAMEINKNEHITAFGSIHPDDTDYKSELDRLKDSGIKGIKLHPDYQDFFIDEKRMQKIYEEILKRGFILLFHAGLDVGLPSPVHATPERIANTLSIFEGEKVCFAHMGGFNMGERLFQNVIGRDVYIDTSCVCEFEGGEVFSNLINAHKPDKILFATDTPWNSMNKAVENINSLNINDEFKEMIFYKNAEKLLSI